MTREERIEYTICQTICEQLNADLPNYSFIVSNAGWKADRTAKNNLATETIDVGTRTNDTRLFMIDFHADRATVMITKLNGAVSPNAILHMISADYADPQFYNKLKQLINIEATNKLAQGIILTPAMPIDQMLQENIDHYLPPAETPQATRQ